MKGGVTYVMSFDLGDSLLSHILEITGPDLYKSGDNFRPSICI